MKATWSPHPHTKQRLGLLIDVASFRDPDKQPPKASRGLSGCVCVCPVLLLTGVFSDYECMLRYEFTKAKGSRKQRPQQGSSDSICT